MADHGQRISASPDGGRHLRSNPTLASTAGVYDAAGFGKDNYAADREVAFRLGKIFGVAEMGDVVAQNMAVQRRGVAHLAGLGHSQFIDIGPAHFREPYLHKVARERQPMARFAYVDIDPVVLAHARALLADENVDVCEGDLLHVEEILGGLIGNFLNPAKPVTVVLGAILHFVTEDEDVARILGFLRELLPPGSAVLITHATTDGVPAEKVAEAADVYQKLVVPLRLRSSAELGAQLEGWQLHEPGIVKAPDWKPDQEAEVAEVGAPHVLVVVANLEPPSEWPTTASAPRPRTM